MKEVRRTVACAGVELEYLLERKPVKNLNLRVRRNGSVYVSAHPRVPLRIVDDFVRREFQFVQRTREKLAEKAEQRPQPLQYKSGESLRFLGRELKLQVVQAAAVKDEGVWLEPQESGCLRLAVRDMAAQSLKERLFDQWRRQQCQLIFGEILAETYPLLQRMGVAYPELRIRKMKARWGSCLTQQRAIILNTQLLEAPRECIEYVVLHELCHFIQPNHSRAFYELVGSFMPDWQQRRAALNKLII